jgi:hypothetical protein
MDPALAWASRGRDDLGMTRERFRVIAVIVALVIIAIGMYRLR